MSGEFYCIGREDLEIHIVIWADFLYHMVTVAVVYECKDVWHELFDDFRINLCTSDDTGLFFSLFRGEQFLNYSAAESIQRELDKCRL